MNKEFAREQMIAQQVRTWDVLDPDVLDVMREVQRDEFVPESFRELAFADTEIPLAHGECMLSPKFEGRMLQSLAIERDETILEIGTGSGFVTACLGLLGARVVSCECHADLSAAAADRLRRRGRLTNVELVAADVSRQFPKGEYDIVVVGGSMPALDPRLTAMLKPGGRLFVVTGSTALMETHLITRNGGDAWRDQVLFETWLKPLRGFEPAPQFVF